jgi:WD domain, G-beta repeat
MGVRWPTGRWQMAISPDSQWLATGGSNGTVRIWDAATGQARALMRVDNMTFACAGLAQEDLPWEARAASAFSTSCALVRRVDRSPRPISRQGLGRNTTGAWPAHRPMYDPWWPGPSVGGLGFGGRAEARAVNEPGGVVTVHSRGGGVLQVGQGGQRPGRERGALAHALGLDSPAVQARHTAHRDVRDRAAR